jgi:hypothetical protein
MPVAKMPVRWTANISEEQRLPRGPIECGRSALGRLAPFKHRTQAEADRYHTARGQFVISEELAAERIEMLARQFNKIDFLNQGAPRPKQVVERLNQLEILTKELAEVLESLDDMTRHRLQTAGSGLYTYRKFFSSPLMEDACVDGLPAPSSQEGDVEQCAWVRRLLALSQYAGLVRSTFLISKGIEDPDLPDKGGNTSLYKNLYGSAAWHLVQEGWHLYDMFKPDEASGTEGGPFHLFLHDVFEYATGLEPEENAKLNYWLKRCCGSNRRMKQLRQRERDLDAKLAALDPTRANQERIAVLLSECEAVRREIYDLWPALHPFSYPEQTAK